MNKYLKQKRSNPEDKESRFDTGPIDLDELENESIQINRINRDKTYKENEKYGMETSNKTNDLKNRSMFSENNSSTNSLTNTDVSVEDKNIDWSRKKLLMLQQKLIESTYLSDSFVTIMFKNYNVLNFSSIFELGASSTQNTSNNPNFNNQNLQYTQILQNTQTFQNFNLSPVSGMLKTLLSGEDLNVVDKNKKHDFNNNIRKLYGLNQTTRAEFGVSTLKIGWPFAFGFTPNEENKPNQVQQQPQPQPIQQNPYNNQYNQAYYQQPQQPINPADNVSRHYFYGPLLLWPITLQTKDRKSYNLKINKKLGQLQVEVNSHIILALAHTTKNKNIANTKLSSFVRVLYNENVEVFANNIIEKYKSFGFNFAPEATSELKRILSSYDSSDVQEFTSNDDLVNNIVNRFGNINEKEIRVLNHATIGSYPIANISLYADYIKMLSSDGAGFVNKIDGTFYSQLELSKEYHKYFSETSLKEIVKLDFSQKKACNVALNDNLVISGAAGNGKSQTISSIIANAVNNLKSVLFSTEKKEAANVIFNRLGRLRNYSLKFFESENFAKDFTTQLRNGLERISLVYGIQDDISADSTNVVSEKLDKIYKRVNDFQKIMMSNNGQSYPEYIFKKNKMKESLKEVIRLVGPILKSSESSSDFWIRINQIANDYNEFIQISKIRENLNYPDDLFTQVFNVIKYYDGNDLFFENHLIQYARVKKINEAFEKLPDDKVAEFLAEKENVDLNNYHQDPKALYWSLYNVIRGLDDYSMDILKSHDLNWYTKTSNLVKQKSTENVVEFVDKYSPDEFDFEFYHDYYSMEKFAADNGTSFQVDNENYYEMIDNLITNKLGEDIRNTEFFFALKVVFLLDSDKSLASQFDKLYSQIKNVESVNSVSDILVNYSDIISLVFPLIFGSPNMISKYVLCKSNLFDICIIDEASMIPLENAFPLLYRSERWIVSGDLKQLPPASYQKDIEKYNKLRLMQVINSDSSIENEEKISEDMMKYKVFETPISLLEYIQTKVQTVVLEYHYRSVKKELFEFSNIVFYRNMIHVADDQKEQSKDTKVGINLIKENGYCENGINKKEAERIVKIVEDIVKKPNHGSIGIITTTNEQRDYIENLLLEHPSKLVTNEFSRISEDGEDESLFVLTCEKVQGSERDNIIISFVASKDPKDSNNFLSVNNTLGILATEVGPNFLNVLITRSRLALFLVNSFETDEIITQNNNSLLILKDYLDYAKLITTNGHDLNDPRVQAIFKPYIKNNAVLDFSNDTKGRAKSRIAPDIKEDLEQIFAFEHRLEIVDGWYEGNVKIDLVIRDVETKRNIMGIMCNEFIFDVMINGKQRDYYNRKFLETRNWKFISISSLQWSKLYKRKAIIDKIINMLTLNITSWKEPLRLAPLTKYAVDSNGNTVIVDDVIKNSTNRLPIVDLKTPIFYKEDIKLGVQIPVDAVFKSFISDENEEVDEEEVKTTKKSKKSKSSKKTTSKKTSSKKSVAKKPVAKKTKNKTSTKNLASKKKAAPKKITVKKPVAKKKPVSKKPSTKSKKAKKKGR